MEYYDHYLIQTIDYQYEIINREYLSFTKNITEEDLQFIESIAPKMENYTTGGGGGDEMIMKMLLNFIIVGYIL